MDAWREESRRVCLQEPEPAPVLRRRRHDDETRFVPYEDHNHDRSWRKAVDKVLAHPAHRHLRDQVIRFKDIIHSGDPEGDRVEI